MPYPKLKPDPVKAALLDLSGNTAAVARQFGVSRQAVQKFIEKHGLREIAIEAKETMKDHVESALYRAALAGEAWAVCFFLKTQAKDRGYVERVAVDQTSVNINWDGLTDDELQRIAAGESPAVVLADRSQQTA